MLQATQVREPQGIAEEAGCDGARQTGAEVPGVRATLGLELLRAGQQAPVGGFPRGKAGDGSPGGGAEPWTPLVAP